MSDDTSKAAAALLYKTTRDVLAGCSQMYQSRRSAKALAECATPNLVEMVECNAKLLHALVLNYAEQVVADMPPPVEKPKPAPVEDWSINLFEPKPEK